MTNEEQKKNMVTYFVLCCHLRDFIEDKVQGSKFNYQTIKMMTNNLSRELEKSINVIFNVKNIDDEAKNDMLDHYVFATAQMAKFFDVGLQMDNMDEDTRKKFSDEIDVIMKKYGINF